MRTEIVLRWRGSSGRPHELKWCFRLRTVSGPPERIKYLTRGTTVYIHYILYSHFSVRFLASSFDNLLTSAVPWKKVLNVLKPSFLFLSFLQGDYTCTFTYAAQGGTNEKWQMSIGISEDNLLFSCSIWRPQGKSYLFFTQFKGEVKGAKIEYGMAYVSLFCF
uniref:Uncharacterized protein n=1 Tax=Podarcis muralis TaxID=64176 RepID=A0A670K7R4_PODMU